MTIWSHIAPYFTEDEKWGNPKKINGFLLLLLYIIRGELKFPIIIHCAYEKSGHSKESEHYKGNAVDFHIKTETPFLEQIRKLAAIFEDLQVADRIGFGIYPTWKNPGFHLDVRGTEARWGRIDIKLNHKLVKQYVSFQEALKYVKK